MTCNIDHQTTAAVDFIVVVALLYFVVTCLLLLARLRGYRNQPYTSVQVGKVYNTLQVSSASLLPFGPFHPACIFITVVTVVAVTAANDMPSCCLFVYLIVHALLPALSLSLLAVRHCHYCHGCH